MLPGYLYKTSAWRTQVFPREKNLPRNASPRFRFSPYLVIKGIARVEEGGAVDALRQITHGEFPPPGGDCPAGFVTRISPRKISGTGPWGKAD